MLGRKTPSLTSVAAVFLIALPAYAGTYVIDGDTISVDGERIRIMGVDAPETFQAKCESERQAGLAAKRFTSEALERGPVEIERHGLDKYRRRLARVFVGGQDLAEMLVAAGLGRRYAGGKRLPWC